MAWPTLVIRDYAPHPTVRALAKVERWMAAFAPTRALGTSGYQLAIHRSHFRFYSLSKTQAGFAAALRQIAGQARSHNDG